MNQNKWIQANSTEMTHFACGSINIFLWKKNETDVITGKISDFCAGIKQV